MIEQMNSNQDSTEQIKAAMQKQGLIKVPDIPAASGKDSNYRRVAKFLLLIGVDEAAKVIPHLAPEQIERIVPEIASIRSVDPEEATVILAEFKELFEKQKNSGGVDVARSILTRVYGEKKAEEMLAKAVPFSDGAPFEYLADLDKDKIYLLLKDESEYIRALVLSFLKPQLAADVIRCMTAEEKSQTVLRLAKLKSVDQDVIRRVDQSLREKMEQINTEKAESVDGRNALAQILKKMSPDAEDSILANLADNDPELAVNLRERLFTIEDFINSQGVFIQNYLRGMTDRDVALLLAGKSSAFKAKIYGNISQGRGDRILEESELIQPVKRAEAEEVTSKFFAAMRRAWESGEIFVKGRDEDEYVM